MTIDVALRVSRATVVEGQFELSDRAPQPMRESFSAAGSTTLGSGISLAQGGQGWGRFHLTAPEDMVSNQASYSVACH